MDPKSRSSINSKVKCFKKISKSNIAANRLTLFPGFLRQGVKSKTTKKPNLVNSFNHETLEKDTSINNPPRLRRSSRLSTEGTNLRAGSYFLETTAIPNPPPKLSNRSKSIFKEIKEKYAQKLEACVVNNDFSNRLFNQLEEDFVLKNSSYYKKKINSEKRLINAILKGKRDLSDMSLNRKRPYNEEEKENFPFKFSYIPQSNWVFQTPPNRKLNYSNVKVDDNCIKPAVLENNSARSVLYEMDPNIKVDLSTYTNRQELDIDKRYMIEVSSVYEENTDNKFTFHPFELENHFLNLTCRPKKVATTVSRIPSLKRKRDIFDPEEGCSTGLQPVNEFDDNFAFLNNLTTSEESFTFKFTANEYPEGSATGHLFDYQGNEKDKFSFPY